jgi:predicted amino acid racemase
MCNPPLGVKKMKSARLKIDLTKIAYNVREIVKLYGSKGIRVIGITKGACGDPKIGKVFLNNGIEIIGDSRISNLARLRKSGIKAPLHLIRLPSLSEIDAVVEYSDVSLNSELSVIEEISRVALKKRALHKIILMVELGDLREGIMPSDLDETVEKVVSLKGVKLAGIGTNLACYGAVMPNDEKMGELSDLALHIENKFNLSLEFISMGNTASYTWIKKTENPGKVNCARLGECLLLGSNEVGDMKIPELQTDTMTLVAEVIESKVKPSIPYGELGLDVFGNYEFFEDRGDIRRIILGVGRQDVFVEDLIPRADIKILGASSDHLIVDAKRLNLKVGDEVEFSMKYMAMLGAMTSPYMEKRYVT